MNSDPHSRNLRLHRKSTDPGTFFVTKCLLPRKPILISSGLGELIVDTLAFSVRNKRIILASFVVMPDHWHALLCVLPPLTLPKAMHRIDTWIGRESHETLQESKLAWQSGFYETSVKTWRQFRYVGRYIEENPVRKGLVAKPEDWAWSSADPNHSYLLARPWPWELADEPERVDRKSH